MIILGLTGSIGMGKSTAARALRRMGVPVFEADREVHRLLGPGGAAVPAVAAAFPGVARARGVDRRALAARVFGDDAALDRLESLLHPLVRRAEGRFLRRAAARREPVAVLDIPLLFETGADRFCDATILMTAPSFVQRARVMGRHGMSRQRFEAIRARQMPDREKRRRADFVVFTGRDRGATFRELQNIVQLMRTPEMQRRFRKGAWARVARTELAPCGRDSRHA